LSLRIAFDLDGVLADMEDELVHHAETLFGEAMTRRLRERAAEVDSSVEVSPAKATGSESDGQGSAETSPDATPPLLKLDMTARQERRLWQHVESIQNFWETLKEIEPGVIERLAAVASDRRWEIIFLTKRPETVGSTAQVQSQRWLESKGFTLPSVYVVQGSRGRIAAALGLDVVIDDRPENCLDVVVDSTARAILVWRDEKMQVPAAANRLGIGVVKSVDECLNVLIQIDSPAREKPGMIDRAMRLLGLKQPAQA
jgi:hypothetical protein